jgi:hypothetical protein
MATKWPERAICSPPFRLTGKDEASLREYKPGFLLISVPDGQMELGEARKSCLSNRRAAEVCCFP